MAGKHINIFFLISHTRTPHCNVHALFVHLSLHEKYYGVFEDHVAKRHRGARD